MAAIKRSERDTIIQALRAGVVPRRGLQHIQVGRASEIEELVKDLGRIAEGSAAIRFVVGEYGSGKTFFINLIRLIAQQKGLVVMSADLAPDRRLHATGGQARGLYAEMARNLSTRTKPDGGAMAGVVERFVERMHREAEAKGRTTAGELIRVRLERFEGLTHGFDFAEVVRRYWEGDEKDDEELKSAALRWMRAEYSTRTDARKALDVRAIVEDASVYDHLKLMALFVREAGYKGLLVSLDEMVNLYKLSSSQARKSNYEQILRILNDVLQGNTTYIGFIMGGTPDFLTDTQRGLYSCEALRSRLSENPFARDGLVDMFGPVIRLASLTPEEMYVMLQKVRYVMQLDETELPDEALKAFMQHCDKHIGEAYFRTPRNTVKAFVNLLSVLEQNPSVQWSDLIANNIELALDSGDDLSDIADAPAGQVPAGNGTDELSSFRL